MRTPQLNAFATCAALGFSSVLPACSGDSSSEGAVPGVSTDNPASVGAPGALSGEVPGAPTPIGADPLPTQVTGEAPVGWAAAAPFSLTPGELGLLPFQIRMQRVATVVGVELDDPLLEQLWVRRSSLGDHNFANNIQPDYGWSAFRMSEWVRGLLPVCDSDQMQSKFPNLTLDASSFIEAAYGRVATPADQTALTESATGLELDPGTRYRGVCLALLSSAEFLVR